MEDSFKARVDRLFGSHLFETVPRSSFPESSWSVVEGEVEKKEWDRKRGEAHPGREETPLASSYDECFSKSSMRSRIPKRRFEDDVEDEVEDLDDAEEEKAEGEGEEDADDLEREERDIRSSIGLDSTLDFEEEEDEYDRAAVGMADASERLYMRDVNDHGPYINYHSVIEETSEEVNFDPDPRADHVAASARLREDKEGSGSVQASSSLEDSAPRPKSPEGDVNLKPILKRKNKEAEARPKKQVRFDPSSKDRLQDGSSAQEETEATKRGDSRIPDYLLNPSKYVCYSLESEENVDDQSNRQAFADFWEMVRARKAEDVQPDGAAEPPGSIAFTPRKRVPAASVQPEVRAEETSRRVNVVAAAEALEDEVPSCEKDGMDVAEERGVGFHRPSRQYRARLRADD